MATLEQTLSRWVYDANCSIFSSIFVLLLALGFFWCSNIRFCISFISATQVSQTSCRISSSFSKSSLYLLTDTSTLILFQSSNPGAGIASPNWLKESNWQLLGWSSLRRLFAKRRSHPYRRNPSSGVLEAKWNKPGGIRKAYRDTSAAYQ